VRLVYVGEGLLSAGLHARPAWLTNGKGPPATIVGWVVVARVCGRAPAFPHGTGWGLLTFWGACTIDNHGGLIATDAVPNIKCLRRLFERFQHVLRDTVILTVIGISLFWPLKKIPIRFPSRFLEEIRSLEMQEAPDFIRDPGWTRTGDLHLKRPSGSPAKSMVVDTFRGAKTRFRDRKLTPPCPLFSPALLRAKILRGRRLTAAGGTASARAAEPFGRHGDAVRTHAVLRAYFRGGPVAQHALTSGILFFRLFDSGVATGGGRIGELQWTAPLYTSSSHKSAAAALAEAEQRVASFTAELEHVPPRLNRIEIPKYLLLVHRDAIYDTVEPVNL
jgi:hypothetical protein